MGQETRLDFSMVGIRTSKTLTASFSNENSVPIPWTVKVLKLSGRSTGLVKVDHMVVMVMLNVLMGCGQSHELTCHSDTFVASPKEGVLEAGGSSEVIVDFCPSLPHCRVTAVLSLTTGSIGSSRCDLIGIGAAANLIADKSSSKTCYCCNSRANQRFQSTSVVSISVPQKAKS